MGDDRPRVNPIGLGLYSNFYSKKAAVEASTADTHCLRYPLQPLQPLQYLYIQLYIQHFYSKQPLG